MNDPQKSSCESKKLPSQIKYIVGNEACERLSYYGVVSILVLYATSLYQGTGLSNDEASDKAKEMVHYWKSVTYLLPLVGALIADRLWGRYKAILLISFAYCAGHAVMSATEGNLTGLIVGLALLAIGSGGIKPSISAFAGDQIGEGQRHLLPKVYSYFYFSINFGSFFAFTCIPWVKDRFGYTWAFLIPGLFMGVATFTFWLGRRHYVRVPPALEQRPLTPGERGENIRSTLRIMALFAPVPFFWAVYDQINTSWVQQGSQMAPITIGGMTINCENMQSLNPVFIMVLIPVFTYWLYPWLGRIGVEPTPLRRMAVGFFLAGAAFAVVAWIQSRMDSLGNGGKLSLVWQAIPYLGMTMSEVLISTTGLEFAFSQAPARLKSFIMSLWLLTVSVGNYLVASITALNRKQFGLNNVQEFLLYAGLVSAAGVAFIIIARFAVSSDTQTART